MASGTVIKSAETLSRTVSPAELAHFRSSILQKTKEYSSTNPFQALSNLIANFEEAGMKELAVSLKSSASQLQTSLKQQEPKPKKEIPWEFYEKNIKFPGIVERFKQDFKHFMEDKNIPKKAPKTDYFIDLWFEKSAPIFYSIKDVFVEIKEFQEKLQKNLEESRNETGDLRTLTDVETLRFFKEDPLPNAREMWDRDRFDINNLDVDPREVWEKEGPGGH